MEPECNQWYSLPILHITSEIATLTYIVNRQQPVSNLTASSNQTVIQLDWLPREPSLTSRYLISVYDAINPDVPDVPDAPDPTACNSCYQNVTDTHYDFTPETNKTCHLYEFRVTAVECLDADADVVDANQTSFTSVIAPFPGVSPISIQFAGQTVQVNWSPVDNSSYRIAITDPKNDTMFHQTVCDDCPPYYYPFVPESCGDYHLTVGLTPTRCNASAFTQAASFRFNIDCPTTATVSTEIATVSTEIATVSTEIEQETGATSDKSATTQPGFQTLLLAIAAIIPMLTRQY